MNARRHWHEMTVEQQVRAIKLMVNAGIDEQTIADLTQLPDWYVARVIGHGGGARARPNLSENGHAVSRPVPQNSAHLRQSDWGQGIELQLSERRTSTSFCARVNDAGLRRRQSDSTHDWNARQDTSAAPCGIPKQSLYKPR